MADHIKELSKRLGFECVGIAAAKRLKHSEYLLQWLKTGHHGSMHWMENYLEKRQDVKKLFPGAKSVVVVAMNYYTSHNHSSEKAHGKISRYAWGKDYHTVMKKKLKQLILKVQQSYMNHLRQNCRKM